MKKKLIASTLILGMVLMSTQIQATGCSGGSNSGLCEMNTSTGGAYSEGTTFYATPYSSVSVFIHIVSLATPGGASATAAPDYTGGSPVSDYIYGSINTNNYSGGSTSVGSSGLIDVYTQAYGGGGYAYISVQW